VFDIYKDIVLG